MFKDIMGPIQGKIQEILEHGLVLQIPDKKTLSFTLSDKTSSVYFNFSVLAHEIKFYDNKLMINKIKDFLKNKLSRSGMKNSSIEEDVSDQDIDQEFESSTYTSEEEGTGETPLPTLKSNWKDKLTGQFTGLQKIKNKIGKNAKEWKIPDGFKTKSKDGHPLLSPSLTKWIEKFFSQEGRETIHQIAMVVIICGITYTLGKMTALVLKGPQEINAARDYTVTIDLENDFNPGTLAQVRSINIFRTNTGLGKKTKVADAKCEEAQQASSLPIKLVNTIVLQDTVKSLASVQIRGDRDLQKVRVGDQISNLAKIFRINRLEILVKNLENGVCESISSDKVRETKSPISVMSPGQSRQYKATKKMSGIDNVGNKFTISKNLLDEKMKDIAQILTQARAIKIQNPDGTISFKLTEMDPEGLFPYLGLQDQDIITSINGKPIYDMNEVMTLFSRIKNLDNLQLGIKREGTDSLQEYSIKK